MEKIKGLAIDLDMDHLSVDRGLKGLKDNLRTVNSEMKANMSVFDRSDRSVQKYETRLEGLNKKLEVQKVAVSEAKKEYVKMVSEHGRGSKEAEKAAREYNNQSASLNNLERYIGRTKDELVKFERQQRISSSSWTKLGDKLDSASNKLQKVSEKTGAVGSSLTNKITKPALIAGTAVAGITAAFGWGRLVGLDSAKAQLEGLGYEAKDVERITKQVTTAIQGGMTTMAEGTAVAAGALAAGVKEGKELERYIKLVGDAAVGANRPVADMAVIFNRVEGAGKMMTMELNSIEQGMPGFSKAMSKHLGVSSEKLRKMVTDGKVSSKDFLDVMEGFAGDMASSYSKSWSGMVSNTKAYIGIIGENLLRGVFKDSKKSLADFIELLKSDEVMKWAEKTGKSIADNFGKLQDKVKSVKQSYDELSPAQQEFVKKVLLIAPAVAIGVGPALTLFSKLTAGVSGTLSVASRLTTAIGVARGAGLAAGLASLGPGAVAGIAVAGLGAVAVGAYTLYKRSKKAKEVSLDLAESLSDQATELENNAEAFDKLSSKAKVSNEELATLHDLNKRIANSSNPGEIKELQEQYDKLAKNSGLSKDELEELFKANDEIIKQSPDVEKSISEQGNAFADNTGAVKDQIKELRNLSEIQLQAERAKLLEQEAEARKKIVEETEKQERLSDRIVFLSKMQGTSQEKIKELIHETGVAVAESEKGTAKRNELTDQYNDLIAISNGELFEQVERHQKTGEEIEENIKKHKGVIEGLEAHNQQLINIRLANAGINEEGEKGLEQLDKSIAKNDEELAKLDEKLVANGKLTVEEQERYDQLVEANSAQREARDLIFEELGVYSDLNSLIDDKMSNLDKEKKKKLESLAATAEIKIEEGNILEQIKKKNKAHDDEIEMLEKKRKKEGANKEEIDEQISALQKKKIENDEVIEKILQELGIWDKVEDSIEIGAEKEKAKGRAVDEVKRKLEEQGGAIGNNNKKTDIGILKEQDRTKEAGKHVTKKITAKDYGTVADIDKKATTAKSKEIKLFQSGLKNINEQASSPISKTINFVGKGLGGLSKLKFWAKGTPPSGHPGGPAVVGDGGGSELVTLPSGRSFLSPNTDTLLDLPRGTHVIPHRETERIMKSMPRYADGTDGWSNAFGNSEFARLLALNNRSDSSIVVREESDKGDGRVSEMIELLFEQNEYLRKSNELLTALLGKDLDFHKLTGKVDEGLNNLGDRRRAAFGG